MTQKPTQSSVIAREFRGSRADSPCNGPNGVCHTVDQFSATATHIMECEISSDVVSSVCAEAGVILEWRCRAIVALRDTPDSRAVCRDNLRAVFCYCWPGRRGLGSGMWNQTGGGLFGVPRRFQTIVGHSAPSAAIGVTR